MPLLFPATCRVRTIAFDVGGTLLTPSPSVGEVYSDVARRHGVELAAAGLQQRFKEVFARRLHELRTSDQIERREWREMVGEVLRDEQLANHCFQELYDHFAQPGAWRMFDDVVPALTELRDAGYQLAVASNFDSRLHSVMDGHPVLAEIGMRVISSEVGWRKPHENFYRALIEQSGRQPTEILMVGDELELDVEAARRMGLRAIHLMRKETAQPQETDVIHTLRDLPLLLAREK